MVTVIEALRGADDGDRLGVLLVGYGDRKYGQQMEELVQGIGRYLKVQTPMDNVGFAFCGELVDYSGEPVAKALIFLPTAISMVGAGVIWYFVYSPKEYGLLNSMYQLLPGEQKTQFFLQENTFFGIENNFIPGINTFFIMIVVIWIQAGFSTVVISAALKGVPDDLVEAARIDGATDRQAFYKVVLPYIKGTIITVATTTTIAVLKIFDIIQTMGKGGSFGTSTIANEMYEQGFPQDNEGLGAAWAVLLFLLVVPIVFVNARNQKAMREAR